MNTETNEDNTTTNEGRLQVRCKYDVNRIHIQGLSANGHQANREYGMALEMHVPAQVTSWLSDLNPTQKSAASSSVLYVDMEAWSTPSGWQFFVRGPQFNHPDGLVLNMGEKSVAVQQMVSFVKEGAVAVNVMAEHYMSEEGEEE